MADVLLRMLSDATVGLALALALRRPVRRTFGAEPAFTLWLLPVALACAVALPRRLAPAVTALLPVLTITPHVSAIATARGGIDWTAMALGMWLAGVVAALLRLAWRYLGLRRGETRAPSAWLAEIAAVAPGVDVRRLRLHPDGPAMLAAWPRSLLLLPADFAERFREPATRALVLRHELTHLRRGDAWWSLAMEIASALLWFHPLAWYARPRFRLDQELACDAAALRAAPSQTAHYARALLDSAAVQPASVLIPWLAEPQLKERIAMLARNVPGALRRRAGFLAAALLLGGGVYAMSGQAAARTTPLASGPTSAAKRASVDVSYKNRNPPLYPADAARNGEQGTVILKATVSAAGKVTHLAIDPQGTTAPQQLQIAALTAAGGWRFNPGYADGHATGGVVTIPVRFSLTGADGKPLPRRCGESSQYVVQIKQCVKLVQPTGSGR